jgi:hypothetical protein
MNTYDPLNVTDLNTLFEEIPDYPLDVNMNLTNTASQPRSQGFSVRTRRDTRKPWSGPVNFAFWLANTILSKNNWTW